MEQHQDRARVTNRAYATIGLIAVALTTAACGPASDAAAPPTNVTQTTPDTSPVTSAATPSPTSTTATPEATTSKPSPSTPATPVPPTKPATLPASPPRAKPVSVVKTASSPAKVKSEPAPVIVMRIGNSSSKVRSLQARLRQIGWFSGDVTNRYGPQTAAAVRGFQAKRGFPVTGALDLTTWNRVLSMTRRPTTDELANVKPKPPEAAPSKPATPATSGTDAKTSKTSKTAKTNKTVKPSWDVDPRCLTGRVMCISKSTRTLTWVIDGKPQYHLSVRFGSKELPTREGAFSVYRRELKVISNIDNSSMPFSMFFSGGEAVHYSPNFARVGYDGNSHGCVNVRDWNGIARLYSDSRLGDKVVVHW